MRYILRTLIGAATHKPTKQEILKAAEDREESLHGLLARRGKLDPNPAVVLENRGELPLDDDMKAVRVFAQQTIADYPLSGAVAMCRAEVHGEPAIVLWWIDAPGRPLGLQPELFFIWDTDACPSPDEIDKADAVLDEHADGLKRFKGWPMTEDEFEKAVHRVEQEAGNLDHAGPEWRCLGRDDHKDCDSPDECFIGPAIVEAARRNAADRIPAEDTAVSMSDDGRSVTFEDTEVRFG